MPLLPHLVDSSSPLPTRFFSVPFPEPEHGFAGRHLSDPEWQTSDTGVARGHARILCIGDDAILMYSRRLVFEAVGYVVATLRSDALTDDEQLRGFDAVVLCHSIPEIAMSGVLNALCRTVPEIPVLLVTSFDKPGYPGMRYLPISSYPAAMLKGVAQQLAVHKIPSHVHGHS